MLLAPALFCLGLAAATGMDTLAKLSAAGRPLGELLVWRGFGALPFLAVFAASSSGWGVSSLRPRSWAFVFGRGAVIALGTLLFFWSLKGLSLVVAYVAAFTAPLMLMALSAATGAERVGRRAWFAVSAGFTGVLLASAPSSADLAGAASLPGMAALAATFLYALGLFLVRHGGGAHETPSALVLGNLLVTGMLGTALLAFGSGGAAPHAASDVVSLAVLAALAGGSQILVTLAFAAAPASRLAPYEYITLPLGAALSYMVWGDLPAMATLAGAAIVVASVAWVTHRGA